MQENKNEGIYFKACPECNGLGKKKRRIKKSAKLRYQKEVEEFEETHNKIKPIPPKSHLYNCQTCSGSGIISSESFPIPDIKNYPHIAIIGAGIGGIALAIGCLHRGIPFTIYERDISFDERSQGYGLTLQQASKAIEGFGIFNLEKGVVSTRHLVHSTDGKIVAEWGMRKWLENTKNTQSTPKRSNIHIARQSLRFKLLEQLGENNSVKWGHQFLNFKENEDGKIELNFQINGKIKNAKADLVVGADGIRSAVRDQLIGEKVTPLRYLDCIVILGICPLSVLEVESDLLDSATVFQTANGNERIYIMPFDKDSVMWQLSFPMLENEAKNLSLKGSKALKEEALRRTKWHSPIPEIIAATLETQISGYPVYDRALLEEKLLEKAGAVTLIGDAAHPMSPFKGQGANQALLDALSLAREISKIGKNLSEWKEKGLRENVLKNFETEMLKRSAIKVEDSASAAQILHSEMALYEANEPRGKVLKRKKI
ncbi:FAD-dependent oxidoreductase [Halpernia sp.]|uniref:FAD-dependent oxidoreductase n=1 Tax=Halpernia sp. TaxID=2782209 RepID=UPI003A937ECD